MKSLVALALSLVLVACTSAGDDDDGNPGSGAPCGGFAGGTCASDEFCEKPDQECAVADGAGVCHGRPRACDDIYMPVRGSDGVVYGNACEAHAAGADDCGPAPIR
jgi:hypothetical protein